MSAPKQVCDFCLEPLSDCLCDDDGPGERGPGGCDAAEFGAAATFLVIGDPGGGCRCIVCSRCGHHTGNARQGHYWRLCRVQRDRVRASLAPGETLSAAELVERSLREFHMCCPDPAFGCELEEEETPVA